MPNAKFKSPIPNLWERELDFMDCLMTMESRGVRINQDMARREEAVGTGRMIQIINELNGLKPTSPTDLVKLMDKIGIPLSKDHLTKNGRFSFDKRAMEEYYDPILEAREDQWGNTGKLVLEYRGWSKTVSSNYRPYQALLSPDGRLRANYWMHGTVSGRLSCREPNLQQIPRESTKRWNGNLKKVFIPKSKYVLLNVDYSQLELRLASAYAKQHNWIEVFNALANADGNFPDVFNAMAETMGIPRSDCKTITYAKMFGAKAAKIALLLGGDPSKALAFIKQWEEEHDRIVALAQEVNNRGRSRGYINYWTGRQRHFPYRGDARKAFNSLIQGGGAEIVKSAMLRLFREVDNPECQMLLQVHDAVVFEILESKVDYYEPIIKELMQDVKREIDFGVNFNVQSEFWGDYEKAA